MKKEVVLVGIIVLFILGLVIFSEEIFALSNLNFIPQVENTTPLKITINKTIIINSTNLTQDNFSTNFTINDTNITLPDLNETNVTIPGFNESNRVCARGSLGRSFSG